MAARVNHNRLKIDWASIPSDYMILLIGSGTKHITYIHNENLLKIQRIDRLSDRGIDIYFTGSGINIHKVLIACIWALQTS